LENLWTSDLEVRSFQQRRKPMRTKDKNKSIPVACYVGTSGLAALIVIATPRPLYPRETAPVPIVQEAGSASGPVWTDEEKTSWSHRGFSSG